jgi:hypothetical protein
MPAARMAPTRGASRNTQSCDSTEPPATIAGPKLRAGFTEAPSNEMPTRFATASAVPMPGPATAGVAPSRRRHSTTSTNMPVSTISIRNAPPAPTCKIEFVP